MKKVLILKGCAGLGNRLITLASAIEYANITNRTLFVDWSDGQFSIEGINAFNIHFELKNVKSVYELKKSDLENKSIYPNTLGKENLEQPFYNLYASNGGLTLNRFRKIIPTRGKFSRLHEHWAPIHKTKVQTLKNTIASVFTDSFLELGGRLSYNLPEDIVIFADHIPAFNPLLLRKHITLNSTTSSLVECHWKEKFEGKFVIGVHVRWSDKKPLGKLEKLHQLIETIRSKESYIYLATDNLEIQNEFIFKYSKFIKTETNLPELPSNIGLHSYAKESKNKDLIENSFKESILDMWLLSKCNILIAQEGSTFSLISSVLKNEAKNTFFW